MILNEEEAKLLLINAAASGDLLLVKELLGSPLVNINGRERKVSGVFLGMKV